MRRFKTLQEFGPDGLGNQYLFIRSLEAIAQHGDLPQIIYLPSQGMIPVMDLKINDSPIPPVE